jgi:nucleolar protein 4
MPLFATDRTLKRLAIHAVREFDNEVKAEIRAPLSRDELMDDELSPQANIGKKTKRGERATVVMQSKIVRQSDRIDPLTGQGKSKGYGFLEMRTHKDALKVLRWANNNPAVGPLMKEWFAVELQDLEKRMKEKLIAAREAKAADLDDLELKYKKLQAKVKDGANSVPDGMRQGKTLMIEFSVENIQVSAASSISALGFGAYRALRTSQVVKRRVEKAQPSDGGSRQMGSDNKHKVGIKIGRCPIRCIRY